jgi:acyl-coenzyme A synthetase/AMP-(fatty) acid ligase
VLPDIPEFAAAYFGTMKIGAVAVPTSTALRASDCAYFLEESRARVAIVHSSLIAEFAPALSGQRYCASVVVCGEPVEGYLHWDRFIEDARLTWRRRLPARMMLPCGSGLPVARAGQKRPCTCTAIGSTVASITPAAS